MRPLTKENKDWFVKQFFYTPGAKPYWVLITINEIENYLSEYKPLVSISMVEDHHKRVKHNGTN